MEKGFPSKQKSKESWSNNSYVRKIDFKIKIIARDKEGHYMMIKRSIQEDITIINIYAPNIGALQYIRQILTDIKSEIKSDNNSREFQHHTYINEWIIQTENQVNKGLK